jgi:hypothetical protein
MALSLQGSGQTSIGLEAIQTKALVQIFENLEDQLRRQASAWDAIDRRLADAMGHPYRPTKLEFPPKASYFPGGRLGVLGMPWDAFPAISVMADRFDPAAGSPSIDGYGAEYAVNMYVEAIVRSDAFESGDPNPTPQQRMERVYQEGLLDRRAKRTMEAIVQCIAVDATIGGLVPDLPAPSGGQTDAFTLQGHPYSEQASSTVSSWPADIWCRRRRSTIGTP